LVNDFAQDDALISIFFSDDLNFGSPNNLSNINQWIKEATKETG